MTNEYKAVLKDIARHCDHTLQLQQKIPANHYPVYNMIEKAILAAGSVSGSYVHIAVGPAFLSVLPSSSKESSGYRMVAIPKDGDIQSALDVCSSILEALEIE